MPDILAITEASMLTDLMRLEIISNNLANANTPGFRRDLAVTQRFGDLLTGELEAGLARSAARSGAAMQASTTRIADHQPGSLRFTDHALHVAIEGQGFLTLRGPEGPVYSRTGNLSLDSTGRLVGANGLPVLGTEGELVLETSTPRIDQQGVIWDGDVRVGQLALARFENMSGLSRIAPGLWAGGQPVSSNDDRAVRVRQGHLENSNVSVMHEMVLLIELMRHFEASQRVIQGYDDILGQALRTIGDL